MNARFAVFKLGPGSLAPLARPSSLTEALRLAAYALRDGGYDAVEIRKVAA